MNFTMAIAIINAFRVYKLMQLPGICRSATNDKKNWLMILAGSMLAGISPFSYASDYGCKVLLCLANPNGPTAVAECVPPIHQLWDDLAHLRAFPSCDMADGNDGHSYAKQGRSYYDPCPEGTSPLARGVYAVQGIPSNNKRKFFDANALYMGIGSGDDLSRSYDDQLPGKVCVGKLLGTGFVYTNQGRYYSGMVPANFYDRVVMLDPQNSPRIIDVYVGGELYRRVRW